jgi:two-component system sensor histidine kinase KdpD
VQLEPVELQALLEDVAAGSGAIAAGRLHVDRGDAVTAIASRDMLEQVIDNLIGNALRHADGAEVVVRAGRVGDEATVEVADRGPGIPPEVQTRIFDRFYAGAGGERGGFGLGLAIARGSTEAMGGTLTIESSPGEGTTAVVTLRAAR